MRKMIFVFALVAALPAIAQSDAEDIKSRILKMNLSDPEVEIRLGKFHKQRNTGTAILLGGLAMTAGGLLLYYKQDNDNMRDGDPNKVNYNMAILGTSMIIIGGTIRYDAYKHLRVRSKK